jgi:hypothetical protein
MFAARANIAALAAAAERNRRRLNIVNSVQVS